MTSRAVAVGATSSTKDTIVKAVFGFATAALTLATGFTALRAGRSYAAHRCIATIWDLQQKVQNDSLDEADEHNLETTAFQALWWTSYMLTSEPPGEGN